MSVRLHLLSVDKQICDTAVMKSSLNYVLNGISAENGSFTACRRDAFYVAVTSAPKGHYTYNKVVWDSKEAF